MGYRIIAEDAGLRALPRSGDGVVQIEDPRWSGYLANLTPGRVRSRVRLRASPSRCAVRSSSRGTAGRPTRSRGSIPAGPTRSASRRPTRSASTRGCGGSPSSSRAIRTTPRSSRWASSCTPRTPATRRAGWGPMGPTCWWIWSARPGQPPGLFGAKITGRRERRDRRHPGEGRRGPGRRGDRPPLSRADRPAAVRLRGLLAGRLRIRRA